MRPYSGADGCARRQHQPDERHNRPVRLQHLEEDLVRWGACRMRSRVHRHRGLACAQCLAGIGAAGCIDCV